MTENGSVLHPMSSIDTAACRAPTIMTPGAAAVVPNPMGRRLRIRQRLAPNVYVADCSADMMAPVSFVAQQLVIKLGRLDHSRESESAQQELRVARQLLAFGGHRHIVRAVETHVANGVAFVVLEHCPGGDLFSCLVRQPAERLSQRDALHMLSQITQGVQYLHQRNIAHRDLSLENVLLSDSECKICDFGLSTCADVLSNDAVGKTQYAAPEVVQGDWYDPVRADMWSLGIILFMMLTGSPLVQFASLSCPEFKAFRVVGVRGVLRAWGFEPQLSVATVDLLSQLLQVVPDRRIASAAELLGHPAMLAEALVDRRRELTSL